ncbi:Aromatic amino acid transport protein AroP OS=Stutzerimonas stutzeri OX=316 GN=CXK95_12890 PE=4 SV=1 [Stutzerimonas stutzeri]
MSLVVASLVINWAMISMAHLKFRKAMQPREHEAELQGVDLPFGDCLCLAFVVGILAIMLFIPGIRLSVYAIPFWVAFLGLCFQIRRTHIARTA